MEVVTHLVWNGDSLGSDCRRSLRLGEDFESEAHGVLRVVGRVLDFGVNNSFPNDTNTIISEWQ